MKNVYVDIHPIIKNKTGIGWYSHNILSRMLYNSEINIKVTAFDFLGLEGKKEYLEEINSQNQMINTKFHGRAYKAMGGMAPMKYDNVFKGGDLYHFLNYTVPPIGKSKKVVINIYDMIYKKYPQTMKRLSRFLLEKHLKNSVHRADKIITISQSSKKDILEYFDLDENKIAVIPPGIDYELFNCKPTEKKLLEVRRKYSLPDRFFLSLGTIAPHKNLNTVFEAYSMLRKEIRTDYKLVVAGGVGWKAKNILQMPCELGIENDVFYTGYFSEEDKPILYKSAKAFMFPSYYEGFGMPVLEALASGIPTITANNSSLMEAGGDAALYVEARDAGTIAEKLTNIVGNEAFYKDNINKGKAYAQNFSWDDSTNRTLEIYKELLW
jgi:glycosyltransferase involved in cell wall biosynthesis